MKHPFKLKHPFYKQVVYYRSEYEKERKERKNQEMLNKQLAQKLKESEEIAFQFHTRMEHLDRRTKHQQQKTRDETTCNNCQQERNVSLFILLIDLLIYLLKKP